MTVPTVERGLRETPFWSMEMAGEALNVVDLRLVHAAEELARVGGQRLDVPALTLGVYGVEGQRALAGARHARDHHELIARDGDVDVLEVVLTSTANDDVF